ncbi:MAG TPA: glycosyltransferase family 9 protein [Chitinispirillaceae bacterium]|nr:glycosyltransferase family 9 protein [Chitinispirillaceae bacterium]
MIENIPEKIIIIRFSSMGDVILVSALFAAIKKMFPDCEIYLVTDPSYMEFFKDDWRLRNVYGISKKGSTVDNAIIETRWDLVVDLQKNRRSKALRQKIRYKKKLGVFRKHHLKRILKLFTRVNLYSAKDSVVMRYFSAAGIKIENSSLESGQLFFKESQFPEHITELIYTGGIIRPLIALIPFAAWKNKEWFEERFVNVGQYFLVKGWDVCILGGPSEMERAAVMAQQIGQRCFSLAGKITLYECGCLLKKCSLALGNDTGLSHLARACGVRTGIIYGPTTRHWGFYPYGNPPFKIFESSWFCRPCHAHGGNNCFFNKTCLKKISSDDVIKGLMDLVITSD